MEQIVFDCNGLQKKRAHGFRTQKDAIKKYRQPVDGQ